jgi:hypothetical protein
VDKCGERTLNACIVADKVVDGDSVRKIAGLASIELLEQSSSASIGTTSGLAGNIDLVSGASKTWRKDSFDWSSACAA